MRLLKALDQIKEIPSAFTLLLWLNHSAIELQLEVFTENFSVKVFGFVVDLLGAFSFVEVPCLENA